MRGKSLPLVRHGDNVKLLRNLVLILLIIATISVVAFYPQIKITSLKVLYPVKYEEIVENNSYQYGLDEALIFAVIRTESKFREKAESHAGAKGLMQLTEETFMWMVDVSGTIEEYNQNDIFTPSINIRFGSMLLRRLLDYFGDLDTALCAYNAGIGNVTNWLNDERYSSDGKTIDNIPFPETAHYVKNVNSALAIYKDIYNL